MPKKPTYFVYAMESPHERLKGQIDSCSMFVFNRTSTRHPPYFYDKRVEIKKDLFKRMQGQLLLASASRGDVIVLPAPELVFHSYKDYQRTYDIVRDRGIKIAFVKNRFNLDVPEGIKRLEAEILRLEAIAMKNMRDAARKGKKLPIGYRWADTTDAIVPDAAIRAFGALIRLLEHQFQMDHMTVMYFLKRLLKGKFASRARKIHLAMLLGWPDVPPSELDNLAYRTNPNLLIQVTQPPATKSPTRDMLKRYLLKEAHTTKEIAEHMEVSYKTAAYLLLKPNIRPFLTRDTSHHPIKYAWIPVVKRQPDADVSSPSEQAPSPPPDPSESRSADQP